MTHTLHRRGDVNSLKEDYVVVIMASKGINVEGSQEKFRKLWEICSHYEVVNFGNVVNGNKYSLSLQEFMKRETLIAQVVFKEKETLIKFLRELKEANLGLSTVVSGLYDEVKECCANLGTKVHTVEHSLGVHGETKKLPPEDILEVTTMCGHSLAAPNLVGAMVEEVKKGKRTLESAADELARHCACGIFNPYRAAQLLKKIAGA
jgi:hypothetical protein